MKNNKGSFTILDRSVGLKGPAQGLGRFCMLIGIGALSLGIGLGIGKALLCGLVLLALAIFLVFSINCIAVDRTQNLIWLYKDYLYTVIGEKFPINDYTSVCVYYDLIGGKYRTKTFAVALLSNKIEPLILQETGNINLAKKLQHAVAKESGLYANPDPIRKRW